jgi:hypothetical protein
MSKTSKARKASNAVFDTIRLLERAHIGFDIKRTRPDSLTVMAAIVGERIEIDIFEDDHIEISRFRGDEGIEGGRDLLLQIVAAELRENYPEEQHDVAAK